MYEKIFKHIYTLEIVSRKKFMHFHAEKCRIMHNSA
jgi:hypothetical protein